MSDPLDDWIEWVEPLGDGSEPLFLRARARAVAAVRRRQEPRYTSDETAVDDYVVTRWASRRAGAMVLLQEKDMHLLMMACAALEKEGYAMLAKDFRPMVDRLLKEARYGVDGNGPG